jgi:hypothetical protein
MRKQLNNPWIVAVLALVALGCVARSLWPEKLQGIVAAVPVAAEAAQPRAAEVSPVDTTAPQTSDDLTALTGTSARRDPFAPASKSAGVVAAIEKPKPDFVDTVHLSALWAQDGATYAVINGNIVHPGDEIGRLKIESASADGVWLVHWKGRDHLALGEEFTLRTPAAGPTVLASSL